jgi:hypothetical protein
MEATRHSDSLPHWPSKPVVDANLERRGRSSPRMTRRLWRPLRVRLRAFYNPGEHHDLPVQPIEDTVILQVKSPFARVPRALSET